MRSRIYLGALGLLLVAGLAAVTPLAGASTEVDKNGAKAPPGQSSSSWTRQFGTQDTDGAEGVAKDGAGNLYVVGYTWGALAYHGGFGGYDAFIRKYASDGDELWTRQFGTPEGDYAWRVAVDNGGSLYVLGQTRGALPGQTNLGHEDAYLRKYDGNGDEIWTRQFGTKARDNPVDLAVDDGGNVYVVGSTREALPDQTSMGNEDAYLRKYDGNGNELWTRQFGTQGTDLTSGLELDGAGNLYVVGPTSGEFPGQSRLGHYDAYLRKYGPDGTALWTRQFGTPVADNAVDVAAGGRGRVYVVGFMRKALPGQRVGIIQDSITHSYDSDGTQLWARQFGTLKEDFATDVAVDGAGNVYVVGRTSGAFPGQTNLGGNDAFVRKYDSEGHELWTYQFGTGERDNARDVIVDGAGNLYVVGRTTGALPGQTNLGVSDAFLVKFSTDLSPVSAPAPPAAVGGCTAAVGGGGRVDVGWILLGLVWPALAWLRPLHRAIASNSLSQGQGVPPR